MKNKLIGLLGGVALAIAGAQGEAQATLVGVPCETCGLALGAPLPAGLYVIDNENYGQRDGQNNRLGANIPLFVWSPPIEHYNTRLEIVAASPVVTHIDGATLNRVDLYSEGLLFALAHDFNNGFNAYISAGPRTDDNFVNLHRGVIADLRFAVSYVKDGTNLTVSANYGGKFGGIVNGFTATGQPLGQSDSIFFDYTATHKFGKFELGVVGTFYNDITGPGPRGQSLSVGPLVGYDFGPFAVQAYVTREVEVRNGGWGLGPAYPATNNGGAETRGFFRIILPLAVEAKTAAPVVARY